MDSSEQNAGAAGGSLGENAAGLPSSKDVSAPIAAASELDSEVLIDSATTSARKRRRPYSSKGSYLKRMPGVRPIKEFPLTKGDMRDLQSTGLLASGCFSFGGALLGFTINLRKDMSFSQSVPAPVLAFWEGIWWCSFFGGLFFLAAGVIAMWRGNSRLNEIEKETEHDEDA
jgi:hypothetical protein